jgi:hypothetical protein
MKKLLFVSASFMLLSALSLSAQDNDSNNPKLVGSGNVITKNIPVQPFDQLDISGVFSVYLFQGDKEEVKIEAEDNLQALFEVKNEGSQLSVKMKDHAHYNSKKKMKVYITFRKLKSMELKTVGDVSSDKNLNFDDLKIQNKSVGSVELKMTTQSLDIQNKSVGDLKLDGKADNAVIKNNGVGNFDAAGFIVQKMDIENTGVGSAEVNAEKELKVKDTFLGKVTNRGNATAKRMNKVRI